MDERMRKRRSVITIMVIVAALVGLPSGPALGWQAGAMQGEMGPPEWVVRLREQERQAQEKIEDLNRRREELAQQARRKEMEMREIEEARNARQREVEAQLREIHEQIAGTERSLQEAKRRQEELRRRLLGRAQEESARLVDRLHDVQVQAERMQQTLAELRARPPGPAAPEGRPPAGLRRPESPREPAGPMMEMREQLGDIRAQVRLTNERVERLESRPQPRSSPVLREQVEQLSGEIGRLTEGFGQMQKSIEALSAQRRQGTVGSAAYNWGWQPYPAVHYYLY
jgi:Skp family chaperone for outer membrane proteins